MSSRKDIVLAKSIALPGANEWRIIGCGMLLLAALGIAACNTIEGAGQDLESAGEAVSDTAHDAAN